jgi:hypothetical protein
MDLNRLHDLKEKLVNGKNFSEIWHFYMDHFADHQEFVELGEPAQSKRVEAAIAAACQKMLSIPPKKGFGDPAKLNTPKIAKFFLIKIPEYQLFHGPVQVGKRMGGMFYFEDIKTGLLAVPSQANIEEIQYSRFSEPFPLTGANPNDYN